jgi:DNA-binding NarL/FixJ family response regulator
VLPVTELDRRRDAAAATSEAIDLTSRERDVLAALIRGLSNREIAAELQLAESTVKLHLSTLMAKLGVTSRVQALVRAHQLGLRAQ